MTLRSIRNLEFSELSDNQLCDRYITAEQARKELIARADKGEETWDEIETLDSLLFRIDDELCARNLDLPTA